MPHGQKPSQRNEAPRRAIILDPDVGRAEALAAIVRRDAQFELTLAATAEKALRLAETFPTEVIFVEMSGGALDGPGFTRKLRRSTLAARTVPVILTGSQASPVAVLAARDAGAHEYLPRPHTPKDIQRHLDAALAGDRDWIEAAGYIGPDRRRFNSGEPHGHHDRRATEDPASPDDRINRALKIIAAAAISVEEDRAQALRAMMTQATMLQTHSTELKLSLAAAALYRRLADAARSEVATSRAEAEAWTQPILTFLPKAARSGRRAA